ncbi:hypothetical protein [Kiloniella sp. b19]|uniref:hypothetical protein n=1 Tax=Kiloniella sp. GXU_MW_B19 TaxID=3141326 RepID=UPI0031E31755
MPLISRIKEEGLTFSAIVVKQGGEKTDIRSGKQLILERFPSFEYLRKSFWLVLCQISPVFNGLSAKRLVARSFHVEGRQCRGRPVAATGMKF